MADKDQGLLGEIERDLLDGKPLADLLRKCVVLGGRAGSPELREWASRELKGYAGVDGVPSYRIVPGALQLDGVAGPTQIRGQRISVSELPDFTHGYLSEMVTFREGVGELHAHIDGREAGDSLRLELPSAADLMRYMNAQNERPFQHITGLYWAVSVGVVHGILESVRTTLAELIAELRAVVPPGQETPTAAQAAQAINIAVRGFARVNLNAAQSSGSSEARVQQPRGDEPGWWTRWRKVGAFVVGAATVAAAVLAYMALK